MVLSLPQNELLDYIRRQSDHFYPDNYSFYGNDVDASFSLALDRLEHCFETVIHPGYHDNDGNTCFYHLHGDQYAQLLWFFSNSLWKISQNKPLCDKLMLLNRSLFNLFISYKCGLPDHFLLAHPFSTILGNADYSDYLVVSQGVTVNTEADENGNPAPHLGKGLFLGAHARIIGNKPVGDYVSIGVGALVYNTEIPDNSVVKFLEGNPCNIRQRSKDKCMAQSYFNVNI